MFLNQLYDKYVIKVSIFNFLFPEPYCTDIPLKTNSISKMIGHWKVCRFCSRLSLEQSCLEALYVPTLQPAAPDQIGTDTLNSCQMFCHSSIVTVRINTASVINAHKLKQSSPITDQDTNVVRANDNNRGRGS